MDLSGRSVLVTGGGSGIGLALTRSLREAGARVAVCGRDEAKLNAARAELPGLLTQRCDLRHDDERAALVGWLLAEMPDLDVLVNNAGVGTPVDLLAEPPDARAVHEQVETDLVAPIDLTLRLLPHLRRRPEAALVFVTSGLVYTFDASAPAYTAAKAGVHGWAQAVRRQLRETSVRVVEVIPPTVDTDLDPTLDADAKQKAGAIPSEDVAEATLEGLRKDRDEVVIGAARYLKAGARLAPETLGRVVNNQIDKLRDG